MQDKELYQQVLGLASPWVVGRVKLNVAEQRVDVFVEHDSRVKWRCPQCDRELGCHDHAEERTWRHLDTCQFVTQLRARVPRVDCPEHGVVQVLVPWAEPRGRFTLLFERLAIDVLKHCQTVQGACEILRISWDQARAVMERAVARGQARKPATPIARIGVDEKAFRRGQDYVTVVCDIDRGTVEHVSEGRTTASFREYFDSLTPEQLAAIEAVSMDMWQPYVNATLEALPLAADKIVFDRFHIMQHATEAVDDVRKAEHRQLLQEGDDQLTGTKYVWLTNQENLPDSRREQLQSLPVHLLKTGRAWALKEHLRDLWHHATPAAAREFFQDWYSWAIRSRLEPIKEERHLLRVRQQLGKLDLLILDELGYVPASKAGAELLFDVIATAYERNSLIVTTNLPFENWTEVLGSERLTGAALDRLTHRCHILETKGESYRLQDAKRRRRRHDGPAS